jgi:hypothetical protein
MSSRMLVGEVVDLKYYEVELERIKRISENLSNELRQCRDQFARMKMERDALMQATDGLRKLFAPLWGELQNVPVGVDVVGVPASNSNARIESAKRRMPGRPAEFIDLLLEHGPMNVTNFVTLAKCSKQTVYNVLSKLGQAGIVESSGGRYSLKEQ